MTEQQPYWKIKSLQEMNNAEWEALCDGCGHCCLHKLQDEDTDEIYITRIACKLLDLQSCRCREYNKRLEKVPMCEKIRPDNLNQLPWLPSTCAYRCLNEGRDLPDWHPLVSGNQNALIEAGVSVCLFAQSEVYVHPEQWPECIISVVGEAL